MARVEGDAFDVEVVYCPAPGVIDSTPLRVQAGATLADAVRQSGVLQRHGLVEDGLRCGIWSKLREWNAPLRARDRIELYRELTVDPKEARRLRYKRASKVARGK